VTGRPDRWVKAAIPGNKERVLDDMGPLVQRAIAAVFRHHGSDGLASCTPEERAAYDAWLQPRIWELAGRLAEASVLDQRGKRDHLQHDRALSGNGA
jgi:hypothetical protein